MSSLHLWTLIVAPERVLLWNMIEIGTLQILQNCKYVALHSNISAILDFSELRPRDTVIYNKLISGNTRNSAGGRQEY